MAIRKLNKSELSEYKLNGIQKQLEDVKFEIVEAIKHSLDILNNIDMLYEIKEYINELILGMDIGGNEDYEDE